MGRYIERLKAEDDAAKAKSAQPCGLTGGKHQWHYSQGSLTGVLVRHCNCGARE